MRRPRVNDRANERLISAATSWLGDVVALVGHRFWRLVSQLARGISMLRIQPVDPAHTLGRSRMLLADVQQDGGDVPPLLRLLAHAPAAFAGYLALRAALQDGTLSITLRERIAIAVAASNGCDECLARHTAWGRAAGLSTDELQQATRAQAADIGAAVALRFAHALIETRGRVDDNLLADLRNAGYSDAAIIEIVAVVVTNLFANDVNNLAHTAP